MVILMTFVATLDIYGIAARNFILVSPWGRLSRYVTSHPGQLSLAIPPWVGVISTSLGWEGNHRSGVALVMRHRQ